MAAVATGSDRWAAYSCDASCSFVSTWRTMASMVSNSACPLISGGASWMTESPRSSVRQDSPPSKQPGGDPAQQSAFLVGVEDLLGRFVFHQLDAEEVPLAADVADDRQVVELFQGGPQRRGLLFDAVVETFAFEDVEVGQRDRCGHRMAAEGVAVRKHRLAVVERLEKLLAGDHRAKGRVSRRQTLGAGDHVGHVVEIGAGEHRPDAAERADHFVGDQQHVVVVADLPDPFEIPGRWWDRAARILHRFEEYRGDGVGPLEFDGFGDAVGGPAPEGLDVGVERFGRTIEIGVGYPEAAGRDRLERRLVLR